MTNDDQFISPRFTSDKLSSGALEDKIDIFEDRMKGGVLQHAYFLTNAANPAGPKNAGFAILMLCAAYFETMGSCYHGRASKQGDSKALFRAGFLKVFLIYLPKPRE